MDGTEGDPGDTVPKVGDKKVRTLEPEESKVERPRVEGVELSSLFVS